jgi:hypothetical protein
MLGGTGSAQGRTISSFCVSGVVDFSGAKEIVFSLTVPLPVISNPEFRELAEKSNFDAE